MEINPELTTFSPVFNHRNSEKINLSLHLYSQLLFQNSTAILPNIERTLVRDMLIPRTFIALGNINDLNQCAIQQLVPRRR